LNVGEIVADNAVFRLSISSIRPGSIRDQSL